MTALSTDAVDAGPAQPPGAFRVAAIDLGTNSARLAVAEVDGAGDYRLLRQERVQTRLGRRLGETGRIDPERAEHTLEVLASMRDLARELGAGELRAVGTAALRDAENGSEFTEAARRRLGLDIEVIDFEKEAELALRSVRKRFALDDGEIAIADIGGGSMEVVFARAGAVVRVHSMPLGAVRLTERFLISDPPDADEWRRLRAHVDDVLLERIGEPPFPTPDLVGSGGTFTALGAMALRERGGEGSVQGCSLTTADLENQLRRLRETPLEGRRRFPGLDAGRADIIPAGAAVVARLAGRLQVERIRVNDGGVRDGLLLEMVQRR